MYRSGVVALAALNLCLAASFKSGKLLEYGEFEKDHDKHAFFCLEAHSPDRILIGEIRRSRWGDPAKLKSLVGSSVLLKYDDHNIWLQPPRGATLRLRQEYLTRAFAPGSACEQIVEAAWNRIFAPPKKLIIRRPHGELPTQLDQ